MGAGSHFAPRTSIKHMKTLTKTISILFSIFTWIAIPILVILAVYSIGSNISLFNGYHSYLVQSGSMEPNILIGDVVITHKQTAYHVNDAITFNSPEANRIVTHRIVEIKDDSGNQFITKGDANREEDEAQITPKNIIGKVIFVIPKLGLLINFSQSTLGLIILIIIPAAGLFFDELVKVASKRQNAQ